jgi:hypothetical protein
MPRQLPGLGSGAVRKRARSRKTSLIATAGSRRIGARWARAAGRDRLGETAVAMHDPLPRQHAGDNRCALVLPIAGLWPRVFPGL